MLFLLSPAKNLDYDTPVPPAVLARATVPHFVPRAAELIGVMKKKTPAEVAQLMNLSDALASLNVQRYRAWRKVFTPATSRPAVLAFNGQVYQGLDAPTLSDADLDWAQQHVAILSGLYGVLRPLDWLQPYRLEMGTKVQSRRGADLYEYWGDAIARHLMQRLADDTSPVVVNLASQEYFKAADRKALKARVVHCVFEEWRHGRAQVIGLLAKRARGLMARHAILQRASAPEQLLGLDAEGYAFEPQASEPDRLVFSRRAA
jgi:uncharacterized protein